MCGCAAILLLLCPLFVDESGGVSVGLGVYDLELPHILMVDLLMVGGFLMSSLAVRRGGYQPTPPPQLLRQRIIQLTNQE
jgi:hypothetical protein